MHYVEKISYFKDQAFKYLIGKEDNCPNCKSKAFKRIDSKMIVSTLRECSSCHLYYRYPKDYPSVAHSFYQEDYEEGFTTTAPSDSELIRLMNESFQGHEKSYHHILDLIDRLGFKKGARVFDFGSSWGYGSWQFMRHGFEVRAFEISRPRAAFARDRMGIDCVSEMENIKPLANNEMFDLFFSNHVIEHVPCPADVVALAKRFTKPGGLFIAVTPNGSLDFRKIDPDAWHKSWGKVHPNLVNDIFWGHVFSENDFYVGSLTTDSQDLATWVQQGGKVLGNRSGSELYCIARL